MTKAERIAELQAELNALIATPAKDWLEAVMKYRDACTILHQIQAVAASSDEPATGRLVEINFKAPAP